MHVKSLCQRSLLFFVWVCAVSWGAVASAQDSLFFDHGAHGVDPTFQMTLCLDGIDNDRDGRADQRARGCKPTKRTKRALKCSACHGETGLRKKIGHRQCKACHSISGIVVRSRGKIGPFCRSCHLSQSKRIKEVRPNARRARFVPETPTGGWSAMRLTFDHERHARWGDCASCHHTLDPSKRVNVGAARKKLIERARSGKSALRKSFYNIDFTSPTHDDCASCHLQKNPKQPKLSPQMSECEGCHQVTSRVKPAVAKPSQTTGLFSHQTHRAALNAPLPCKSCHTEQGQDSKGFVKLPTMQTCATCHVSGGSAFDLNTQCQRCHPSSFKP